MIDIETIGKLEGNKVPVVTEIGVVFFEDDPKDSRSFQGKIILSVESCLEAGFEFGEDTIEWWMLENSEIFKEMIDRPGMAPGTAINLMNQLFLNHALKNINVWANSPSFDCYILSSVAKRLNLSVPWQFWQERCVRTIISEAGIRSRDFGEPEEYGVSPLRKVPGKAHDALYDSVRQANMVRCAKSKLKPTVKEGE